MREIPESFKKPKNCLMDLGKTTAEEKDFKKKCHCFKACSGNFKVIPLLKTKSVGIMGWIWSRDVVQPPVFVTAALKRK